MWYSTISSIAFTPWLRFTHLQLPTFSSLVRQFLTLVYDFWKAGFSSLVKKCYRISQESRYELIAEGYFLAFSLFTLISLIHVVLYYFEYFFHTWTGIYSSSIVNLWFILHDNFPFVFITFRRPDSPA